MDVKKIEANLKHIETMTQKGSVAPLERYWDEIVDILSDNLEETKKFLNTCDKNTIWLIASCFEDISANFQSKDFIAFLHQLQKDHPTIDIREDIEWAEEALV